MKSRVLWSGFATVLLGAVSFVACRRENEHEPLPVKIELQAGPVRPKAEPFDTGEDVVDIDVKTSARATIDCYSGTPRELVYHGKASDTGTAKLTLAMRDVRAWRKLQVACTALVMPADPGGPSRRAEARVEVERPRRLAQNGNELRCVPDGCQGKIFWREALEVSLGVPIGGMVEIAGQQFDPSKDIPMKVKVPKRSWLEADLESALAGRPGMLQFPLTLTFSDGRKLHHTLRGDGADVISLIRSQMQKLKKGPVLFDGETAATRAASPSLLSLGGELFGKAATLADVDMIALSESITHARSCGTYQNAAGSQRTNVTQTRNGHAITVYERRTGRVLGHKVALADYTPCPGSVLANRTDQRGAVVSIPQANSWLWSLVHEAEKGRSPAIAPGTRPAH